ncbi:AMP-binding protein [Sediminitomix flava]|uniref:Long-chain-fatty-acid--CoA ligase n=1 Tax=Sediminitomix flava TaxID=379075 RepID=A0A315ZDI4_SEDFL|nr:AMP-binding protein [Sediminitomix flava]PWJ43676.1 long-chain acyl-CoA synthetase [Sediminitomix flava]
MLFPWYAKYDEQVVHDIDLTKYNSILDILEEGFEKYADQLAYECMGQQMTYRQVDEASKQFAAYLQKDLGLQKGDRVAIQMPNTLQYPIVMFGVLRAGMIVVNTNPLYTEREMKHQFNDAGVKAIVILANFASKLERILKDTPVEHIIVTELGDLHSPLKGWFINTAVKHLKKMVPAYNLPTAIGFKKVMKKAASLTWDKPKVKQEDAAFLQYTGGTTGVSKGAILSHRNIIANVEQNYQWMRYKLNEGEEVVISALPLYHVFSMSVNCLTMFRMGAFNVLVTNPKDIPGFIKILSKHRFTFFTGVNTLFNALMNDPSFAQLDFSGLHISIGGGMAVQQAVANRWEEMTGCPLMEGYGLSETSPVVSTQPFKGEVRLGTIGLPFPSTQMSVRDDDGNVVEQGEAGEICIKGPQVFSGYWNLPEETKEAFFEGDWFRSGDIGTMDEDGYFRIVDRKKDMILVSGFNVYPNEVEDVLAMHESVAEVAVIGIPDEKTSEAVKAYIVFKEGKEATDKELQQHCRNYLTNYKVPKHYSFEKELPKSGVGKILRRLLKEDAK